MVEVHDFMDDIEERSEDEDVIVHVFPKDEQYY